MNKISSRTDWLLDSLYTSCFVCGEPISEPPKLDRGRLSKCLWFSIIVDEYGNKQDTEERICNKCWVSDLPQFGVEQEPRLVKRVIHLD